MDVIQKAIRILEEPVCDHCLGRQFARLLSGYTNEERGKIIRNIIAMIIDSGSSQKVNLENFRNFKFFSEELKKVKYSRNKFKCSVCKNIFSKIEDYANQIVKQTRKLEFKTFLIGTKLPYDLVENEERLWERVGIDYCEPIKAELNREIGKLVEKKIKAEVDFKNPEVNFVVNIYKNLNAKIETTINPLFIYGEYQKLIRNIPQTKWPSGKYKTSVEEIIAKPFMKATKGSGHKFHGMGREDIDARCLAWRPFVLEIIEPKKRRINLKEIAKKIPKKVKVRNLRFSDIDEVRKIKEAKPDKEYKIIVKTSRKISKTDLRKLKKLVGEIRQKTPKRVLHRRSDRLRKKIVKRIRTKFINSRKFELYVLCSAGLYVKELVTGDDGRTKPSVSEILGCKCSFENLDVIKILA